MINNELIYGELLGPRVTGVHTITDYQLLLTFNNNERRIFDAKPLLKLKVFEPLRNEAIFNAVKVSYGSIMWPQDIDYCPDTLYIESVPEQDFFDISVSGGS
ncbi:MAG: DUF2442 domain-containing protein [Clostridiales bacterium]|jgi:hypothetical protein|nr:DUF2442 domain-containing protein [Clostridiales bacterium]